MDEELKNRFTLQKLHDLLSGEIKPYPTILCERERPDIIELVRKVCIIKGAMVPFRVSENLIFVQERLDLQRRGLEYGNLYIDVNVN